MLVAQEYYGTEYPEFTGYIQSITEGHDAYGWDDVVTVRLADPASILSKARITDTFEDEEATGTRVRRFLDHADVLWPGSGLMSFANFRNLDAGSCTLQEQEADDNSALELIDAAVRVSERGRFFFAANGAATFVQHQALRRRAIYATSQGVFGDAGDGIELPYRGIRFARDVLAVRNRVTASVQGGTPQIAEEQASIDRRGRADEPIPEMLLLNNNDAFDVAAYEAFRRKDPVDKCEPLVVEPVEDGTEREALWPLVLSDNLQYRYTVRRRKKRIPDLLKEIEVQIEGIDKRITYQGGGVAAYSVTYTPSLSDPNSYWRLGHPTASVIGSTTRYYR